MKTVATRLSRDWSLDEALGVKKRLISKDKIYDWSGNKKKGFIYIVENKKNKKIYIGLTTGTIKERFSSHIYNASKNSHKDSLGYAIWNYGSDMFAYKELKKATIDQLGAFETKYINQYNRANWIIKKVN